MKRKQHEICGMRDGRRGFTLHNLISTATKQAVGAGAQTVSK